MVQLRMEIIGISIVLVMPNLIILPVNLLGVLVQVKILGVVHQASHLA